MSTAPSPHAGARSTLERLSPAAGRPLLLYALYTLALFVLFLLATFPYDAAIRQAIQQAVGHSMTVEVTGARLGWTLAVAVDDLRLVPKGTAGPPILTAQAVRVRPSLLGLLRGTPFPIRAQASLYGGTVTGTLDPRPQSLDVDTNVRDLDLGRYAGLEHFSGGMLRGRINVTLLLKGDVTEPTTLHGSVAVNAVGLALEGIDAHGVTLPDLHFGQVQAGGTVTDGRLELTELRGIGTEIDLAGSGHLLLRDPIQASLLNLAVTLTPTAAAPQGLRLAMQLVPGTEGPNDAHIVRISGTLGAPTLR